MRARRRLSGCAMATSTMMTKTEMAPPPRTDGRHSVEGRQPAEGGGTPEASRRPRGARAAWAGRARRRSGAISRRGSRFFRWRAGCSPSGGWPRCRCWRSRRRRGLRQSSLYYWFRRKELIVAEILQQVNRLPLSYARSLEAAGETADVQLWRFVRFDVQTVCGFPLEITEIHRFSERDPAAFATYWAERRALTEAVAAMVGRGMGEEVPRGGRLPVRADGAGPGRERAELVPAGGGGRVHPLAASDPAAVGYAPEQIAELVADQTVGGLLVRPSRLAALRRKAGRSRPRLRRPDPRLRRPDPG